jgi:hypothetical protein
MVLFDQLRGIVREGDARVKARATVEHHRIVLRTGGQIHSFLSLQIESGFVLQRRESYSLRLGIISQTAGELLPPLGHISSYGATGPQHLWENSSNSVLHS